MSSCQLEPADYTANDSHNGAKACKALNQEAHLRNRRGGLTGVRPPLLLGKGPSYLCLGLVPAEHLWIVSCYEQLPA